MNTTQVSLIEGVFIKELKNRFLCEVLINGQNTECYVPSSCHLSNFIDISNCNVLLTKNPDTARTKYSLFAFKYKNKYILLNTSIANKIIFEQLQYKKFNFLGNRTKFFKEQKIDTYKSDIYIEDSKTIIEIKSLLTIDTVGLFPTVYSERSIMQLNQFKLLLSNGYKVFFFIVSLNPYVKEIKIKKDTEFYILLSECLSMGLELKGLKLDYNNSITIKIINCDL